MKKMTIEKKGRGGDNVVGHLTKGELVLPKEFLESAKLRKALEAAFEAAETDMDAYIVGNKKNSINPETGYPEFFSIKRFVKKIQRTVDKFVPEPVKRAGKKLEDKVKQEARNLEDNIKDIGKGFEDGVKSAGRTVDDIVIQPVGKAIDKLLPEKLKDDILGIDPPPKQAPQLGNPKEAPKIDKKKKKKNKGRATVSAARSRMSIGNKQYRAGGNLTIAGKSGPNVAG